MVFANGSLLLTQVRPRNAGVYRCIGQGQRGPPIVLEATLHLAGESLALREELCPVLVVPGALGLLFELASSLEG